MLAFVLLLIVRLACAKYSIIPDCDEVFNYWEPLHYITHGFGRQTWEYSPEYAIRSWVYVALHSAVIQALELFSLSKVDLFYGLRFFFAIVSAMAEYRLYCSIRRNLSRHSGVWYLLFSGLSTGMFHASVSFLPSSFAMHMFTFGLADFLNYFQPHRPSSAIVRGVLWTAVGGLVGWPFSLVLVLPFGLCYGINSLVKVELGPLVRTAVRILLGVASVVLLLGALDSMAYQKVVLVPLNIVLYNVVHADATTGPDIFGVEPWHYYVANLVMNFNVVFCFAIVAPIAVLIPIGSGDFRVSRSKLLLATSPFLLWLSIFIAQPHKEERFMYVVYQSLCLNGALAVEVARQVVVRVVDVPIVTRAFTLGVLAVFAVTSVLRSTALAVFYGAPTEVYAVLSSPNVSGNVCVGREWYRFPSSYFLNDNTRIQFIKSGFSGLLPGEFEEATPSEWWWNRQGTRVIPKGMNNKNQEDPSKYVSVDQCDYVVDTSLPVDEEVGEQQFTDTWAKVYCGQFLNSAESRGIGRILYLPQALQRLSGTQLQWTDYCIVEKVPKRN
uniref:Mannosyltransferase n=1 Tax=Blastobotrys adeninivorans TaxID=409370 RepID=A0A060SXF9_BLAAD